MNCNLLLEFFFSITARCVALAIKECKAAVVIQSCWRGWVGRKHCVWRRRSIIRVQCRVRQWIAIRRLKELKVIEEREREGGRGKTEVAEADILLCTATNRLKHALCLIFKTSTKASSSRL